MGADTAIGASTKSMGDIEEYLERHKAKSLLRFITCGSVDDGKSSLIGRLLYESKMIFEDQFTALREDSKRVGTRGGELDFALLVDGLAAEREQGITIDVAYRFFTTEKRKFIVADTPGHEQYTRNMVTGASTADLAVILIDARKGVLTQTRRHSYLAALLGIRRIVVAVNKMDLVDYSAEVFAKIERDYREFARQIKIDSIICIPVSAVAGDNVTSRSARTPWYLRMRASGAPGNRRRGGPGAKRRLPHAGAMGQSPESRVPGVCRAHRQRNRAPRRLAASAALRAHDDRGKGFHRRWRVARGPGG